MSKEKIRVYALAREMNVETKDLLDLCKQAGFDVKNQLSNLEPEQRDRLLELVKKGSKPSSAAPQPAKPVTPVVGLDEQRVRNLASSRPKREETRPSAPAAELAPAEEPTVLVPEIETVPEPEPAPVEVPAAVVEAPVPAVVPPKPATPAPLPSLPQQRIRNLTNRPGGRPAPSAPPPAAPARPEAPSPAIETPAAVEPIQPAFNPVVPAPAAPSSAPPAAPASMPTAAQQAPAPTKPPEAPRPPIRPTAPPTLQSPRPPLPTLGGGRNAPPQLGTNRGPQTRPPGAGSSGPSTGPGTSAPRPGLGVPRRPDVRPGMAPPRPIPSGQTIKAIGSTVKAKENVLKPIAKFTKEQLEQTKPIRAEDLLRPKAPVPGATPIPGVPGAPTAPEGEDDEEKGGDGKKKKAKEIPGRDTRRAARNERAEKRKQATPVTTTINISRGRVDDVLSEANERVTRIKDRHHKHRHKPAPIVKKTSVEISLPITVRSLSEAIGVRSGELLFKLIGHGAATTTNINSNLDAAMAELVAIDYGKELIVRKALDEEEQMLKNFEVADKPEDMFPRPPIVTIMGHVDHGKTSLLDRIRESNVVDTEAGGITQVIRAWKVDHHGKAITFLDTPGHEAFTKMRARGAQVTDIAVIVVAADDGVMPQTEEAISHAKAAGVSLVVAINKTDMPMANVNRTRQQLYGLSVLPDDMGGDSPFVETSAVTGKGLPELLEAILLVAELKDLKGNPNKPASGTCLEAALSEGEGVRATVLVREGTLNRGDVVLCGHAHGRIRQMYDDMGRSVESAGPSMPVRITGLDAVPNADDAFHVLPDLTVAREIAEKRLAKIQEATAIKRPPMSLERLAEAKIVELKLIVKADFRGSIEAIKKELEKLVHDEVRVRVLHAGIGAITESDVQLALTSPEDTLVVGFNVVPDDNALRMAEEKNISIREYDIIYNLTNDIKAALEGKLKPREEVVHLGRAVVRETFKISKVGTIAGCYVTQGNIKRNAKIRVIRDGVVIYPPADKTAGLESLKRFKDDTGEVREGFECGIKIAGYDDIKVGDVIEAFRIDTVQRKLD